MVLPIRGIFGDSLYSHPPLRIGTSEIPVAQTKVANPISSILEGIMRAGADVIDVPDVANLLRRRSFLSEGCCLRRCNRLSR